jgi:hypothetical protein
MFHFVFLGCFVFNSWDFAGGIEADGPACRRRPGPPHDRPDVLDKSFSFFRLFIFTKRMLIFFI